MFLTRTFKKYSALSGVYGMGFNAPSKIQETALPTLLADPPQNMIAQSQSGTGKTAAFVRIHYAIFEPLISLQVLMVFPGIGNVVSSRHF